MAKADTIEIRNMGRHPLEIHAAKDQIDPTTGVPFVVELGASDDRGKGGDVLQPRQTIPRATWDAIKGQKFVKGLIADDVLEAFE